MGRESGQPEYEPSAEEIAKAEAMMTPEQRQASEERAENHIQELPPWEGDFNVDSIDENYERRPPTAEEREKMDRSLAELAGLMSDSSAQWQLDGASNISLYKGDYIGVHKDIDISVEPDDMGKFEGELGKKGFGIFDSEVRNDQKAPRRLRRLSAREAIADKEGQRHLVVMRIDEKGKILSDDSPVNGMDLHVIERDEQGQALGRNGVRLPDRWMEPRAVSLKGGQEIKASHPARVMYFKLHQARDYDWTDLNRLAETGALEQQDIDEARQVLEQEDLADREGVRQALEPIVQELQAAADRESVLEAFRKSPTIGPVMDRPDKRPGVEKLAERLLEAQDKSLEGLMRETEDFIGQAGRQAKRIQVLDRLSRRLAELDDTKKARDSLGNL